MSAEMKFRLHSYFGFIHSTTNLGNHVATAILHIVHPGIKVSLFPSPNTKEEEEEGEEEEGSYNGQEKENMYDMDCCLRREHAPELQLFNINSDCCISSKA